MALLKKKDKANADKMHMENQGEGLGSKIVLAFVTLLIIVVWLAIIGLMIKLDVGGFGSTVLRPIIKDIPYLNLILPEEEPELEDKYQFETIEDAITRIKELEGMLDAAYAKGDLDETTIAELKEQLAVLAVYKQDQDEFEKIKEKWYQEVIFGTENVDYKWYKTYFESIDPENAEVLYKQVVEQYVYDQKIKDYVASYSSMPAKSAAAIFDTMTNDLQLVADILLNMDVQSRADILAKMEPANAAKLTAIMEPKQ